jgi:hypothetical protein
MEHVFNTITIEASVDPRWEIHAIRTANGKETIGDSDGCQVTAAQQYDVDSGSRV